MKYAQKALLYEVIIAPKPGLVDRFNNGSHHDMDMFTFMDAITALSPYLYEYALMGVNHSGTPKELFNKARELGYQAELEMMKATKNVNTHKGANFSFAVLIPATAYIMKKQKLTLPLEKEETEEIFAYISTMCEGLVAHDFRNLEEKESLSYGERLFKDYGITGIRALAEAGYPVLTKTVMPFLRENLTPNLEDSETVFLHLLLLIMSEVEDTNLIQRGGIHNYLEVQKQAKNIYQLSHLENIRNYMTKFDQILIEQHLSPGGAADILSLSIYLAQLEGLL